jgi:hypothetical protein
VLICPIATCADVAAALASIRAHNQSAAQYVGPRPVSELEPAIRAVYDVLAAAGGSLGPCTARDKYTRGEDVLGGGCLVRAGERLWLEVASPGGGADSLAWLQAHAPNAGWTRPAHVFGSHVAFMALLAVAKCKHNDLVGLVAYLVAAARAA